MKFLLKIDILRAAFLVQAKNDIRYYLNGIHFHNNRVEATDGHRAYMATDKSDTPDWRDWDSGKKDIILLITGKIPVSKKIAYASIESDGDEKFIIRYLDLYGSQVDLGMANAVDGKFPNIPKLIAGVRKKGSSGVAVGFNTEYLADMDKMFNRKRRFPLVKMEVFGAESAAIFTNLDTCLAGVKELFMVMPARF